MKDKQKRGLFWIKETQQHYVIYHHLLDPESKIIAVKDILWKIGEM